MDVSKPRVAGRRETLSTRSRLLRVFVVGITLGAGACGGSGARSDVAESGGSDRPVGGAASAQSPGPNTAAPGTGPFDSQTQFCSKTTAPAGTRNSSNPGVTPNSITFSNASIDGNALRKLGVAALDYQGIYKFFIDKINDCGGINGRKIIQKFAPYNPLTPTPAHFDAVCVKATEDQKAFIVMGLGASAGVTRCMVTRNHKAIFKANAGATEAEFRDGKGQLFSQYPSAEGTVQAFIADGVAQGTFKGKQITILGADYPPGTNKAAEQKTLYQDGLKEHGIDADLEILPCSGTTCTAGIGNAVRRIKASGTNLLVLSATFPNSAGVGALFRELNSQNVNIPVVSPFNTGQFNDLSIGQIASQAGTDGMNWVERNGWTAVGDDEKVGIFRSGKVKESTFAHYCNDLWAKANNQKAYAFNDTDFANWATVTAICAEVRVWARALLSVGNNLTTERAIAALNTVIPDQVDTSPTSMSTYFYRSGFTKASKVYTSVVHYPCPLPVRVTKACSMPVDTPIRFRTVKY